MARPRIFISSTFYDLRQIRSDLDRFIKDLGYEPVRNEAGQIPYGKDEPLEDYCYKEISQIDILIAIIGGRFGSSSEKQPYSITQTEIKTALKENKQVYIFIDKSVKSEYQTYLVNKKVKGVQYRFVDNIKVYEFIEEIEKLPKNNVIQGFESAQDIVSFLKEQWAGLFRDLLYQSEQKKQLTTFTAKINELSEVNATLKRYLEEVLSNTAKEPKNVDALIKGETARLQEAIKDDRIKDIPYINHLITNHNIDYKDIKEGLKATTDFWELQKFLYKAIPEDELEEGELKCMEDNSVVRGLNRAKSLLNLEPYREYFRDEDDNLEVEDEK